MSATFYVLPGRQTLARQFQLFLDRIFPEMTWNFNNPLHLADTLEELIDSHPNAFLVFREDLAEGEQNLESALRDIVGAEEGDVVIEIGEENDQSQKWEMGPAIEEEVEVAAGQ